MMEDGDEIMSFSQNKRLFLECCTEMTEAVKVRLEVRGHGLLM